MITNRRNLSALALSVLLAGCATGPREDAETSPVGPSVLPEAEVQQALRGPVDFQRHVRPILQQNCAGCHDGTQLPPGYLNLTSRESTLQPGPFGPRIVPGDPDKSLLIRNLDTLHAPVKAMPPVGNRLTADEKTILRRWITAGAVWPRGAAGQIHRD